MRLAIDTGGTFTDLVVEADDGRLFVRKAETTPHDPAQGILAVIQLAANDLGLTLEEMLARSEMLVYGTTAAINAILTGRTARTAFLTTAGHPDVLLIREGGRENFNLVEEYPEPYVPRSLTFEITERIGSQGEIVTPLDEDNVVAAIERLRQLEAQSVAVCFLWSIVNPAHELRVGELLDQHLKGVPYTLSHDLNPCMREYRRASSTAIDASLKPVISTYLTDLDDRIRAAGFNGRLLLMTSGGGVVDVGIAARAPIHLIKSGPAAAPVAGQLYGKADAGSGTVLVIDTGGTSCDVSLVRRGTIPLTRETWLGPEWTGHMTGFPSIDVRSIGAGGGSIAWVDEGGLLHVGPESAGAVPGPACYGKGGTRPTVTDACVVLGYIDPGYFLGGDMQVDLEAARGAVDTHVGQRLGLGPEEAAAAIVTILTEQMVQLIEELSVNQGVDPRSAALIAGGGAAGLNVVSLARRLESPAVIIPETGPVLSAFGALSSDLSREFMTSFVTSSEAFDFEGVNAVLAELRDRCHEFMDETQSAPSESQIRFSAEMRYPSEVWELEVPLRQDAFLTQDEVEEMRQDLNRERLAVFNTSDPSAPAIVVGWHARVSCRLRSGELRRLSVPTVRQRQDASRKIYFPDFGYVQADVRHFRTMTPGESLSGPMLIESPDTTVVIDPDAAVELTSAGSLRITPDVSAEPSRTATQGSWVDQ